MIKVAVLNKLETKKCTGLFHEIINKNLRISLNCLGGLPGLLKENGISIELLNEEEYIGKTFSTNSKHPRTRDTRKTFFQARMGRVQIVNSGKKCTPLEKSQFSLQTEKPESSCNVYVVDFTDGAQYVGLRTSPEEQKPGKKKHTSLGHRAADITTAVSRYEESNPMLGKTERTVMVTGSESDGHHYEALAQTIVLLAQAYKISIPTIFNTSTPVSCINRKLEISPTLFQTERQYTDMSMSLLGRYLCVREWVSKSGKHGSMVDTVTDDLISKNFQESGTPQVYDYDESDEEYDDEL